MTPRSLDIPEWPDGAEVAVSLTFDLDAESSRIFTAPGSPQRLSYVSEARYGIVRGLPRILWLLELHGILATFYVPGDTAQRHTAAVRDIAARGHEIGHHGYRHLKPSLIPPHQQREEIENGLHALAHCCGVIPTGYRSPGWELTSSTLQLLLTHGLMYDSSCMGDDRPYVEVAGADSIIELPVHWSLDDWLYFSYGEIPMGRVLEPSAVFSTWWAEFESAKRERRHVTYTFHPELSGRGYPFAVLSRLVEAMSAAGAWFATHRTVAELVGAQPATTSLPSRPAT